MKVYDICHLFTDGGKTAFTLWPSIGPHIVEFPAERYVYVREDKTKTSQVKCLAVGKYNITYEWKTYYDVSQTQILIDHK